MGLDPRHVRDLIVRPTLEYLGLPGGIAAEKLVLGTAAQESKFKYLRQLGYGPALGIFQMEPATFRDLQKRMPLELMVNMNRLGTQPDEMTWNLRFACAMCRVHYYLRPFKIAEDADMPTIAGYWKKHFNTRLGVGTPKQFLASWKSTGCDKLYD